MKYAIKLGKKSCMLGIFDGIKANWMKLTRGEASRLGKMLISQSVSQ
jgi:hypothetical protein